MVGWLLQSQTSYAHCHQILLRHLLTSMHVQSGLTSPLYTVKTKLGLIIQPSSAGLFLYLGLSLSHIFTIGSCLRTVLSVPQHPYSPLVSYPDHQPHSCGWITSPLRGYMPGRLPLNLSLNVPFYLLEQLLPACFLELDCLR